MDANSGATGSSRSYLLKTPGSFDREVDRLRWQAELLFSLEWECLKNMGLAKPLRLLELGCGNAQYLAQWQKVYPETQTGGLDRHEDLLRLAQSELPLGKFFKCDLLDRKTLLAAFEDFKPDTVILRFVLQHLNGVECSEVLSMLRGLKERFHFQLILVDPDDSAINYQPPIPQIKTTIESIMSKQAKNGGDRTRGKELTRLLHMAGFAGARDGMIDVGSATTGWNGVRSIYLPLWKQVITNEADLKTIEDWITSAENGRTPAHLSCPIHVVLA